MLKIDDIARCANVYLAAKDKSSKYLYCNEKFAELLDLESPNQIVGRYDDEFFAKQTAVVCCTGDSHVLKGGGLLNVPETIVPHCGTMNILIAKSQAKDKYDTLAGVVLSFIEVSGVACMPKFGGIQYDERRKVYSFKVDGTNEFFTAREYEIFQSVFLGLSAKQIAFRLKISPRTVECHLEKIKAKLQCTYKSHIAEAAIRYGIVQ